jgi:hypothetical protein
MSIKCIFLVRKWTFLVHKCKYFPKMYFLSINAITVHKTSFSDHKYGTPELVMFPADPDLRTHLCTFLFKFLRASPAAAPAPAGRPLQLSSINQHLFSINKTFSSMNESRPNRGRSRLHSLPSMVIYLTCFV